MRITFLLILLVAVLFGSGFWYSHIPYACKAPVHYRIGNIDARFGTNEKEIERIATRAEALWEDPLKTELFVYDPSPSSLPINLVYDERQANAERQAELKADLDAKQGMSESVAGQYEKLITEFRTLKKSYESQVVAYESALEAYNAKVSEWNSKGGAPEGVIDTLRTEERELKDTQTKLEKQSARLNSIVSDLNRIGARGNELITNYNSIVEKYNKEFSEGREFTQGDYKREGISIYEYGSEDELVIVLAHEFGHALSFDHVTNAKSIMYHLMKEQRIAAGISEQDKAEYVRVCTNRSLPERALLLLSNLVSTFAL